LLKLAKEKGVTISIIGISDEACGISILGNLAQKTSGNLTMVKPLELQRKMRQIIDNPVIATGVKVSVLFHPYLTPLDSRLGPGQRSIEIGNVTDLSDFSLKFGLSAKGKEVLGKLNVAPFSTLPFQIQISYTKTDFNKVMRVITQQQMATFQRSKAEESVDVSVIAFTATQGAAIRSLVDRAYSDSLTSLLSTQKLLDRVSVNDLQQEEYDIYIKLIYDLDVTLRGLTAKSQILSVDKATQTFYDTKSLSYTEFVAGSRKDISKRKKHVGELKSL